MSLDGVPDRRCIRACGRDVDVWLLCRRVDKPMDDHDALRSGAKVVPLHPKTIDDGEIRLGPARVELLTAVQEAQAVELLTALFAAAFSGNARRC